MASPSSSLSPPAAALGSRVSSVTGGITSGVRQKKKRQLIKARRDMGLSSSSLNSPSSSASLLCSSRSRHNARWWWFQEVTGVSRTMSEFTAAASAAGEADGTGDDDDGETEKAEKDKRQMGSAEEGLAEQYPAKAEEPTGDGRGRLDNKIPQSPEELIKRVSSRGYDLRRQLKQTIDSIGYDVLESNPWREHSKPVYVLTHKENQLCTMKTRRSRSEVERELGLLFSKQKSDTGVKSKPAKHSTKFHMLVEDIREGILVFEDEQDAEKYCDLLQGGKGCEGIAEVKASSVFDICRKMKALAVLFRRGRIPPLPETLELNLKARNRSLEDN